MVSSESRAGMRGTKRGEAGAADWWPGGTRIGDNARWRKAGALRLCPLFSMRERLGLVTLFGLSFLS